MRSESARAPTAAPVDIDSVYRTHAPFVWRCVRYRGVPESWAEDAVQEVFIVAHRRLSEFAGGSMRAWLYAIAGRVAANTNRRERRAQRRIREAPSLTAPLDPERVADQKRAFARVSEILDSLRPHAREVFVLMDIEGLSAPAVAELTGVNLNTIYARLRAARQAVNKKARALGGYP